MGFTPSSLAASGATALQDSPLPTLDWHALKSRFVAAHALRRELSGTEDAGIAGGSFVQAGARALALHRETSRAVNLTVSGNGKARSAMKVDVIGTPTAMTEENYD